MISRIPKIWDSQRIFGLISREDADQILDKKEVGEFFFNIHCILVDFWNGPHCFSSSFSLSHEALVLNNFQSIKINISTHRQAHQHTITSTLNTSTEIALFYSQFRCDESVTIVVITMLMTVESFMLIIVLIIVLMVCWSVLITVLITLLCWRLRWWSLFMKAVRSVWMGVCACPFQRQCHDTGYCNKAKQTIKSKQSKSKQAKKANASKETRASRASEANELKVRRQIKQTQVKSKSARHTKQNRAK